MTASRGELQVLVKEAKNLGTDKSEKLNNSYCQVSVWCVVALCGMCVVCGVVWCLCGVMRCCVVLVWNFMWCCVVLCGVVWCFCSVFVVLCDVCFSCNEHQNLES